jgi:4-hydroxyproline epimerase
MQIIDSHTEGEPTRMIIDGGPPLGDGPLSTRLQRFAASHDRYRSFAVNEPRGNDAVVGALLCEPVNPACAAGLIFFNNVGYLGMCGHGTIGAAVTLAHMGRIGLGQHRFETPVGEITVNLITPNEVEIENVPSYRLRKDVSVDVPDLGTVVGDIAWGGNWFFLVSQSPYPLTMQHLSQLSAASIAVSQALAAAGITGEGGAAVDHIEFFGPAQDPAAHSRNFVMCPGGAYDRSPCGTGTSAKLACLAADGKLEEGREWIQESVIGSRFSGSFRWLDRGTGQITPTIVGRAYVNAMSTLLLDDADPFQWGIR